MGQLNDHPLQFFPRIYGVRIHLLSYTTRVGDVDVALALPTLLPFFHLFFFFLFFFFLLPLFFFCLFVLESEKVEPKCGGWETMVNLFRDIYSFFHWIFFFLFFSFFSVVSLALGRDEVEIFWVYTVEGMWNFLLDLLLNFSVCGNWKFWFGNSLNLRLCLFVQKMDEVKEKFCFRLFLRCRMSEKRNYNNNFGFSSLTGNSWRVMNIELRALAELWFSFAGTGL